MGAAEVPRADSYPPYVRSEEQRRRWALSEAIARELFAGAGEAAVWMAARSIYMSPLKT